MPARKHSRRSGPQKARGSQPKGGRSRSKGTSGHGGKGRPVSRDEPARAATDFEAASAGTEPLWLRLALDAIARHRATKEPLERAVKTATQQHRPSSEYRRLIGDAAYGWARRRVDTEIAIKKSLKQIGGRVPQRRQLDAAETLLALRWAGEEHAFALGLECEAWIDGLQPPTGAPSLPAWLEKEIHLQDDVDDLLQALGQPAPIGLAVDPRYLDRQAVVDALVSAGVQAEVSKLSNIGIRAARRFPNGSIPKEMREHVWPMDEGSQNVALAAEATASDRVLDLCAGGGGKARLLETTGCELLCMDINEKRLAEARRRAPQSFCLLADGKNAPFLDASFDVVLIDAPCSGTGTLRRAPDLAARLQPEIVDTMIELQKALLHSALRMTKVGGRVVYATCSLLKRENEDVIEDVIGSATGVKLGSTKTLRPDREGTDGFYIAVLQKT